MELELLLEFGIWCPDGLNISEFRQATSPANTTLGGLKATASLAPSYTSFLFRAPKALDAFSNGPRTAPLSPGSRTRWTLKHLLLYLSTRDFTGMVVQAFLEWDLETAIYQVSLLSYATHDAINRGVFEGRSVFCDTCCMYRWGQADSTTSTPWRCDWCCNISSVLITKILPENIYI